MSRVLPSEPLRAVSNSDLLKEAGGRTEAGTAGAAAIVEDFVSDNFPDFKTPIT